MKVKQKNKLRWTFRFAVWRPLSSLRTVFLLAVIGCMAILFWGSIPVLAQEAISKEPPSLTLTREMISKEALTSAQLGEDVTPMDDSFQEKPSRPGFFPWLKVKLKDTPSFFRDTKLDLNIRTYYLTRDKFDSSDIEAWTIGGSLSYTSGWFLNHFGVGAAVYTSQPIDAPDERDGTLLLQPGQEGYTVLGQLYGKVKIIEGNFITLYRSEYNTPYMNKNDSRMTPNTFEGYTFTGAAGGENGVPKFNYGFGYIDKIKPRNSDEFISMSEAVSSSIGVERGVYLGGLNVSAAGFSIGAIEYYSEDIINIAYAEAKYTKSLTENLGLSLAAQYTDQRSTGDNLLKGNSFNVNQVGLKGEMSYAGAIMTLAYTTASKGTDLQAPWSSYPGYTSVQVQDFNRAAEDAFMIKGSYDFSKLGIDGVTAYALWVHGWSAIHPVTKADVYNQDEYDFDLQWRPKNGIVKGLWFRIRYAHIDQRDVGDSTMDDFRIIVNYDLPLL